MVSAPRRGAAFEASRHAIERIKEIVPIWKREVWSVRLRVGRQPGGHQNFRRIISRSLTCREFQKVQNIIRRANYNCRVGK